MNYHDAEPITGSGATAPTMDELRPSFQALDYLAAGVMPSSYGVSKPATKNAAAAIQKWLAEQTTQERASALAARYAAILARFGFAVPLPRITPAEIAARNAAVNALTDNIDAAQLMADNMPADQLAQMARQIGLRPDLREDEARAAFAKWLAEGASADGIDLVKEFRKSIGQPITGSGASFGAQLGGTLKKAVTRPADYFQSLGEEIGKGLAATGKALLKARKIGPLGTYFLDPLGITLQATFLSQLGNMLKGHSVSDFNVIAMGYALAGNFTAVGQALITAAPFTGPWAPLFAACGAITMAMGKTMRVLLDAQGKQAQDATGDAQAREVAQAAQAEEAAILANDIQGELVRFDADDSGGHYIHWIYYARSGWQRANYWDGTYWQPLQAA